MKVVQLSEEQRRVVEFKDGALLVVAGPGTGKTRVLTERVRRLLTFEPGHFRVLALTFTTKAAAEMIERLEDLGDQHRRAFVGTLHGFCLSMLGDRGKPVGITSLPQIFERSEDRRQILLESIAADPDLRHELAQAGDDRERNKRIDEWLRLVSYAKAHPITMRQAADPLSQSILEAYNAGLRACGAFDFDDLLLLAYQLLTDYPQVADFYRRLYRYICIDEAQDLNEAQYSVIRALCGDEYNNVMMVGDPKQAIYGFNTSSPKYMRVFAQEFQATTIELTANYRSSKAVVDLAKHLERNYIVEGQLPIRGEARLLVASDENDEARIVQQEIDNLLLNGHRDVEGKITHSRIGILARTRYALLAVERVLAERGYPFFKRPFFKRLSTPHEYESSIVDQFILALRILANPRDQLHLAELARTWGQSVVENNGMLTRGQDVLDLLDKISRKTNQAVVVEALRAVARQTQRLDILPGLQVLRTHADSLEAEDRRTIYDDTEVLRSEWDQYLRGSNISLRTVGGFLSAMALGITQRGQKEGIALLTVHSAKGLEFDVVFIMGMVDGVFPDFRARGKAREMLEERRNAFVAITRSKRLLYLSFPRTRRMPWGDVWKVSPSQYLREIGLLN